MSKLVFRLEEQHSDLRSNEIAYRFVIDNEGDTEIRLISLTPRIPESVDLVEVKSPSLVAIKSKHVELCDELTTILRNYLRVSSDEFRQKLLATHQEAVEKTIAAVERTRFISTLFRIMRYTSSKEMERDREVVDETMEAFSYNIENAAHAEMALNKFLSSHSENSMVRSIFEAKWIQLKALEAEMGTDVQASALATIQPGSFFGMTYILRFPRNMLNSRKFNIAIEGSYIDEDGKTRVGGASASLIVSPRPIVLTIVAVFASVLGVMLGTLRADESQGQAGAASNFSFPNSFWPVGH
jgi:hypothetical protein